MDIQSTLGSGSIRENKENFLKLFKNEIKALSYSDLTKTKQKIHYLCKELDPFNCTHLSQEVESILNEYQLHSLLENPFDITNFLLKILDLLETETKNRQN